MLVTVVFQLAFVLFVSVFKPMVITDVFVCTCYNISWLKKKENTDITVGKCRDFTLIILNIKNRETRQKILNGVQQIA